ncbi:MAG: uroporphyrinogen decarboxylase family protein [Omnitrophica WOR_2 bacterium]
MDETISILTPRQRLQRTLSHVEPGNVVVDLGSTAITGISASALARLRRALGLKEIPVRVHEPFQILGFVDDDLISALGIDVVGIWPASTMFGYRNDRWKSWRLFDGTDVMIGEGFVITEDEAGNIYLHPNGDPAAPPTGKLPKGGFYFDNIIPKTSVDEAHLDGKADFAAQYSVYTDEECRSIETQARDLYENTSFGLIGQLSGGSLGDIAHVPGPNLADPHGIRDPLEWYIAHKTHPEYIKDIFAYETEITIRNAALYWQAVGSRAEAVVVSGTDFGTQRSEFISPDLFRQLYKPYYQQINDWIHAHTTWKTFFHSCGSIVHLLDDFIECGVDILNPVQCSAAGMDPAFLKERYGKKLVFWGGGVNTQETLPFGTPEAVRQEVLERLRIFAPGGGYVFNTIHNIQQPTPVANILAMMDAVQSYNRERAKLPTG